MVSTTKQLAGFIVRVQYEDLPEGLVEKLKVLLLDTLGCAIGGAFSEEANRAAAGLLHPIETGSCGVWLRKCNTNVLNAITINGVMTHSLELDDLHKEAKVHPGTVIVPTILTLADVLEFSGKDLLLAMAVGYETMIRVAKGVGTASHRRRGWHATSTCGAFGAAVATCKLLGLDQLWTSNALGLAGTQAGGLSAFLSDSCMCKRFHAGKAGQNGIQAAMLARAGFTGPVTILEAEDGGYFKATSDDYDFEQVTKGLGEEYLTQEVGIKYYACCGHTHQAIEAALELKAQHRIDPRDIKEIKVHTYDVSGVSWGFSEAPRNTLEAQFSMPYVVAVGLIDDCVFLEQFLPEKRADKKVNDLAKRVKVVTDSELTKLYPKVWCSEVFITMKDGTVFSKRTEGAKGDPAKPLSLAEVQSKFKSLSSRNMPEETQKEILHRVEEIEKLENAGELTRLLR